MITNYFANSNQISTITYYNNTYISKRKYFNYKLDENNSILCKIEYYNKLGLLHRFNKPALIYYHYDNGKPYMFYYYINGKLHNSLGPAIIVCKNNEIDISFYINGRHFNKTAFFHLLESKLNEN